MYCMECGNKLIDGARFCSKCDARVADDGSLSEKAADGGASRQPAGGSETAAPSSEGRNESPATLKQAVDATKGCCSIETARQIVVRDIGLFSEAEWDAASDGERAAMFAKSLVQDAHTGNGALRTNYEAGSFEVMGLSADGTTYAWEACSIVEDPATGEARIVADGSGRDWGPSSAWGVSADDPIPTWRFIGDAEE